MKIFISWSGERSKLVAELLDDWLQCVLQAVTPWMSTKDIDRGALWFNEISDQLTNTNIGIICLTKENKVKPWILFEAGALAKGLSSARVCTFLIDLVPTDLENPLAQFNHTIPEKQSVWELVRTININLKEGMLKESILLKVFETYWPQFETEFLTIKQTSPETEIVHKRKDNEVILEVLSTVRSLERRISNMESSNIESHSIKTPFRLSLGSRIKIKQLLSQNKTTEEILSEFSSLPNELIMREIQRFSNDNTLPSTAF